MNDKMDELASVFDIDSVVKSDPPIGDTTLRNPLIQRVHQVLNEEYPDETGYCRLMLSEIYSKGFTRGTLDECKFLSRALDVTRWNIPAKFIKEAERLIDRSIHDAVRTYILTKVSNVSFVNIPYLLKTYTAASLMITLLILKTTAPVKFLPIAETLTISPECRIRCGSLTAEISYAKTKRIVPRDFILLLSDCLTGRCETLLFCWLSELFSVDLVHQWEQILELYKRGDLLLSVLGQNAYKRFKLLEAVMTSKMLRLSGANLFPSEFTDSIQSDVSSFNDEPSRKFFEYIESISNTAERCADLFGLFRMWGHPILDTYASRDRVKTIAQAVKSIKPTAIRFVEIAFKKHLCVGYFNKHGYWPNLNVDELSSNSEVRRCVETGTSLNLHSRFYNDHDWLGVKGCPTFNMPVALNLATLLADKSHSLNRTELEEKIKQTRRCGTSSERRVILSFLGGKTPTVSEIVEEFSAKEIDREYLVFGLREKEREVSPWARLFGLMTLPCRFYFVLTEHLLATDIVPLFPETTVGDSAIVIRKKKQQIYQLMTGEGSYLIGVINLDFEKWNLNMRYESTEPAFSFLDSLYNSGHLFRNSHIIFSKSVMYLCHGVHPVHSIKNGRIDPLTGPNVWSDHLGGIEGLRQKGWTLMTIAILKEIAEKNHVSMQLLGQGDNQVLCVKVNLLDRSESAIEAAVKKFVDFRAAVLSMFDALSLPIKAEETWSSSELFAYGKDLYYQGKRLGLRLKRASRTNFLVNEGYPSLTDYIGSLSSAIVTLNDECHSSLIPWVLYHINLRVATLSLSYFHPILRAGLRDCSPTMAPQGDFERTNQVPASDVALFFSIRREAMNKWLIAAKSPLTGIPGLCPLDLMVHGFPDGLTLALTWLYSLSLIKGYEKISSSIAYPFLSKNPSPLQLCEDPTSIPLMAPPAIKNRLRALVSQYLSGPYIVRNRDFRNFLTISLNGQLGLAKLLFQITPCNPRLMADIIAATPIGQATAIVSQVSSTTTMNKLMFECEGDRLTNRMRSMEYSLVNWITYLAATLPRSDQVLQGCPTAHARWLRKVAWGKPLIGVSVPLSFHYLTEVTAESPPTSYVIVRSSGVSRALIEQVRGPYPEYIGSTTREKTAKVSTVATANLAPLILRPLRLLRLIGWIVDRNSSLESLLKAVYSSATNIEASQFIHQYEQVSGSAEHRYEDARTSHTITPSGSWLAPSHCLVNLAHWSEYCKGSKNKTILFQELIITQMKHMYERTLFHPDNYNLTHWYTDSCKECIIDTYDGTYSLPDVLVLPDIPSFPTNETLYLDNSRFSRVLPLVVRFPLANKFPPRSALLFSYGVHLSIQNERLPTALISKIDPLLVLEGFCMGLIAKYFTRRLLNHATAKCPQLDLRKIARKTALDDLNKFVPLELLTQYSLTRHPLMMRFGITAMPSEFPIGKTSRRSATRLMVASLIYEWAVEGYNGEVLDKLMVEQEETHYSVNVLTLIVLLMLIQNRLKIDPALPQLLTKLDSSCRSSGQSKHTSMWVLINSLHEAHAGGITTNSICYLSRTFEMSIKSLPSIEESKVCSTTLSFTPSRAQSIECPVIKRLHNSEITVLYPKKPIPIEDDRSARHRLWKPFSHPTSAWYKWACILIDAGVSLTRPCCLADGAGGLSRYCYDISNVNPHYRTVFFSTLPITTDADEFTYESMIPPILTALVNVYGEEELLHGYGDLTDHRTFKLLVKAIVKYEPSYITCDAEHINKFRDNTKTITNTMISLVSATQCTTIFKSYREPYDLHRWQLTTLVQSGVNVRVLFSPYSPEYSSECFLVLTPGCPNNRIEVYTDRTVKNSFEICRDYLDSLSMSRIPLYSSISKFYPVWETVVFDLAETTSIRSSLYKIIAHTERQLTSTRYFPDVGRPGVGKVQYISSSNLSWLALSHHALQNIAVGLPWYNVLTVDKMDLYLVSRKRSIQSSLTTEAGAKKYIIKQDAHFRNVRRRWVTYMCVIESRSH